MKYPIVGRMRFIIVSACSLLLVGCASYKDQRLSSIGMELYFRMSNEEFYYSYDIRKDGAIEETHLNWWKKKSSSVRHITQEGWREFNDKLNRLQVKNWLREYEPKVSSTSAYSWELRIVDAKRHYSSKGYHSGPAISNPSKTVEYPIGQIAKTGDSELGSAAGELWEASR